MDLPPGTLAALDERERALDQLLAAVEGTAARSRAALAAIDAAHREAQSTLGATLVSSLDAAALDALAAALAAPALTRDAVRARRDDAERALRATLAALPSDVEPIAFIDARIEDARGHVEALRASVKRVLHDEDFRLLEKASFRGEREGAWYTFSYQRDSRRAQRVVARHGGSLGVHDYATLRARVDEEQAALRVLEEELRALTRARVEAVAATRARREASERLASLDVLVLDAVRADVVGALRAKPSGELRALAAAIPSAAPLLVIDGLAAKRRYVDAAVLHHLDRTGRTLAGRRRDVAELRTGRILTASPEDTRLETRRLVDDTTAVLRVHVALVDRIMGFTDYPRARSAPDALWWDLFTDGAHDGSFIDEVVWRGTMTAHRPPAPARVATWTENAASAAERLAAIWDTIQDAPDAPLTDDGWPRKTVPAPVFDDED